MQVNHIQLHTGFGAKFSKELKNFVRESGTMVYTYGDKEEQDKFEQSVKKIKKLAPDGTVKLKQTGYIVNNDGEQILNQAEALHQYFKTANIDIDNNNFISALVMPVYEIVLSRKGKPDVDLLTMPALSRVNPAKGNIIIDYLANHLASYLDDENMEENDPESKKIEKKLDKLLG